MAAESNVQVSRVEASQVEAQKTRNHQLVWPREHGAWGMLLIPLITGAWMGMASGGHVWGVLLFAAAAFALFCLRTPVESLAGTSAIRAVTGEEKNVAVRYAAVFGGAALVPLVALFWSGYGRGLVEVGAVAAVALMAQMAVKKLGRKGRMPSQVIGALALTSTAPAAYYAATGHLDVRAMGLWLANWVFAGNQIHFVQLRLRASKCQSAQEKFARGSGFFLGQVVMMLLLGWAWAFAIVPGVALLAFVPAFVRGMVWFFSPPQPLALRRLGLTELAHSVAFGMLLVIGLHWR